MTFDHVPFILAILYLLGLPVAMRCVARGERQIPLPAAVAFMVALLWPVLYPGAVLRVAVFGFREGK